MKKITMMDIAKKAGVSKATVSMVLNKKDCNISMETKERVINISEELGYIPNSLARGLSTKKTGTIGIVLPDILNPFFSEISRAIEDAASQLEYNVIFCNTDNDINKEEKYIKLLIGKLVDGVIFAAGGKSDNSVNFLSNNNIPFVLIDRYIEGHEDSYGVYCHNREGVIDGVNYLYGKGKRKIAYVMGPSNIHVSMQRLKGYKEAMDKYSLYNSNWVFQSNLTMEGGMQATREILDNLKSVDAILYANDMMALGGMKLLIREGYRIPEDISIMGFDNIKLAKFAEPELTTIGQPIYEMGQKACEMLTDIINGRVNEKQICFYTQLIIRGTA